MRARAPEHSIDEPHARFCTSLGKEERIRGPSVLSNTLSISESNRNFDSRTCPVWKIPCNLSGIYVTFINIDNMS
ncbi:predicted protein [Botrytis cinerea T4]|uniref:Uncharacterized protein n=1 Tax=Botryotinia fuckeliana (strain T4) TaxID=999810 RepID=G2XXH1_BOTF4|nr:predicted protein [Botrytis cinerea T4]